MSLIPLATPDAPLCNIGGDLPVEMRYGMKETYTPLFQFQKILPDGNQQSMTISNSAGNSIQLQIPANSVVSLSKSTLSFLMTPTSPGASLSNCFPADTVPYFKSINFYPNGNSRRLVQINNIPQLLKSTLRYRTSAQILAKNDVPGNTGTTPSGVWEGLFQCGPPNFTIVAATASHLLATASNGYNQSATGGSSLFTETDRVCEVISTECDTVTPIQYDIPLSIFGDIFASPVVTAWPQSMFIELNPNVLSQCGWIATSATPSTTATGFPTNLSTGAAVLAGNITLTNIQLNLAYVVDPTVASVVLDKVLKSPNGLSFLVDYTSAWNNISPANSIQAYNYPINASSGPRLKQIITTFMQTETLNNIFNNNNVAGAIYTTLQTWLNNQVQQQVQLNCQNTATPYGYDDYRYLRQWWNRGCGTSSNEFYTNATYIDSWCNTGKNSDPMCEQGLDILSQVNYMMQLATPGTTITDFYIFSCTQRVVTLSNKGVFLDGS